MVARSQLGNNAAIHRVEIDLRMQRLREYAAPAIEDGNPGLIA
jgi:hypothetical protein